MKKKIYVFSEKKQIVSSEEVENIAPRCLAWGSCFIFSSRTSSPGAGEVRAVLMSVRTVSPHGLQERCRRGLLHSQRCHIAGLSPLAPPFRSKVIKFCALVHGRQVCGAPCPGGR